MATNVTASEVRYTGNLNATAYPDARIASAAFIPVGDGWLNNILSNNGYDTLAELTTADAHKGALAKAAECYYVAALLAAETSKDNFKAGPVESKKRKAPERTEDSDRLMKLARKMIDDAGLVYEDWGASYAGGDDYHPEGVEDTQIDFGLAYKESDESFNSLGVEE